MLRNRKRPFFCSTPITSKRRPSIEISLPTGSTNGNSASTMSVPITATGAARSTSLRAQEAALLDVAVVDALVGLGRAEHLRVARLLDAVLHGVGRDPLQGRDRRDRGLGRDVRHLVHREALAAAPLVVVDVLARAPAGG